MPIDLTGFEDTGLTPSLLGVLLDEHQNATRPGLERLWAYYRNPRQTPEASPFATASRRTRQAQEQGLPPRLRSTANRLVDDRAATKEVVIENDIGWRIDAMVDFVFGKPVTILSTASDPELRSVIERTLDRVWEVSGGVQLLQDTALLGGVYGFADLIVRTEALFESNPPSANGAISPDQVVERAGALRIELVEGTRAVPVLDPGDYRRLDAYIVRSSQLQNTIVGEEQDNTGKGLSDEDRGGGTDAAAHTGRFAARVGAWLGGRRPRPSLPDSAAPSSGGHLGERAVTEVIEILSPARRKVLSGNTLVVDADNPLNEIPVVHIQNASQPFAYAGISDVEPLIGLQDELNTRLSDRAHRVTMQSFNMYLAKGLDGFGASAVGPGQVWSTDNPLASVQPFGGDAHAPSEQAHIEELRDALDKSSGVSPVALGVIRAKLGHLSSENALRITLNGVLSKTARKRVSYGRGIAQACRLILKALDAAGVLKTTEADRGIRLHWQDPLPLDERARLNAALLKRDLGVPVNELLAELGYAREDAGVT